MVTKHMENAMYMIKTDIGYVYKILASWCMVQMCDETEYAKKFKTIKAAEKWIEKYHGTGYGMPDLFEIVNI